MPDEAAFYGPKIDMKLVDAIGRKWQFSTVQFDFTLPRRFGLEYIAEDGKAHQPLMVHRALYGSVERFFGILWSTMRERFPVWLAPVQAVVLPITDRRIGIRAHRRSALVEAGIRVTSTIAGEGESEDSRRAIAEGSLHAGGRRPRGPGRHRLGAQSQARRSGREIVDHFLAEIQKLIDTKLRPSRSVLLVF